MEAGMERYGRLRVIKHMTVLEIGEEWKKIINVIEKKNTLIQGRSGCEEN